MKKSINNCKKTVKRLASNFEISSERFPEALVFFFFHLRGINRDERSFRRKTRLKGRELRQGRVAAVEKEGSRRRSFRLPTFRLRRLLVIVSIVLGRHYDRPLHATKDAPVAYRFSYLATHPPFFPIRGNPLCRFARSKNKNS